MLVRRRKKVNTADRCTSETLASPSGSPCCPACGRAIASEGSFCPYCGHRTTFPGTAHPARKEVWEGVVHKCPSCGELLESFEAYCPACGLELRDVRSPHSVAGLSRRLDEIESRRIHEPKRRGLFADSQDPDSISQIDRQKISLIETYPVPNSIEDIREFVILATSSVNAAPYRKMQPGYTSRSMRAVSDAWLAKCEQVLHKATILMGESSELDAIRKQVNRANHRVEVANKIRIAKWVACFSPIALLVAVLVWGVATSTSREAEDTKRLDGIVAMVQQDLDEGEYYKALLDANSIRAHSTASMVEEWEIERDYWMNRTINEAADQGVDLTGKAAELEHEYQMKYDEEYAEESEASESYDRLSNSVDQFKKAFSGEYDSSAQEQEPAGGASN